MKGELYAFPSRTRRFMNKRILCPVMPGYAHMHERYGLFAAPIIGITLLLIANAASASASPLNAGIQAKLIGGIGPVAEVALSDRVYVHGAVGTLLLLVDIAVGPGVRMTPKMDLFLRYHRMRTAMILSDGDAETVDLLEIGWRWRLGRKLWVDAGIMLGRDAHWVRTGRLQIPEKQIRWHAVPNIGLVWMLIR